MVHQKLSREGWFITGNIVPNLERPFVTKGVGWTMIYRTPEQLQQLVYQTGFNSDEVEILLEPLGVHALCIAKNQAS